ncbi:MAG: hypothetical protein ACLFUW_05745 [Bacteroidales bacterium]
MSHKKRYEISKKFLEKHINRNEIILDLGEERGLSYYLKKEGFQLVKTNCDLDIEYNFVKNYNVITAFEIFEHMFAPFNLLNIASGKLVASVPLRLWFAKEHWTENNPLRCHYHEFSRRQFDLLLHRTGWEIKDKMSFKAFNPYKIGVRPILRKIYPRYYIVYAEKQ